jgi:hypothetical protein
MPAVLKLAHGLDRMKPVLPRPRARHRVFGVSTEKRLILAALDHLALCHMSVAVVQPS